MSVAIAMVTTPSVGATKFFGHLDEVELAFEDTAVFWFEFLVITVQTNFSPSK
jgi:hypothetical protein